MHTMPDTMKAVVLTKPTAAEDIILTDVPVPAVKSGWVLVKIHTFGLNHSEHILRQFEIEHDYIQKTIIPGIECVEEIADASVYKHVQFQKRHGCREFQSEATGMSQKLVTFSTSPRV